MNTANKLTLTRIVLIPLFLVVLYLDFPFNRYLALAIFVLASVTDFIDGYIARHYDQVTDFGKFMDPLADKLMTFTVIICITAARIIPVWAVAIFFLKEAAMGVGALSMYHKTDDVIPSNWLGKASTGVFFVVCAALVLFPAIPKPWATGLITFALALTIAAFLRYLWQYLVVTGRKKAK